MTAAGLILAAGRSTRFGSDKLSAEFRGKPMLDYVIDAVLTAGLEPVVVVVAGDRRLDHPSVRAVVNPDPSRGLSSSLQVGLAELSSDASVSRAVLLLGDQPNISPAVIALLLRDAGDRPIAVPRYADGQPGNPVVLARAVWPLAAELSGDRGMVQLFATHSELVRYVDVGGANPDVDTPAELYSLEQKTIVAAGYDALATDYASWSARVDDPTRARLLASFMGKLPAGAAVLDLGCGPGVASKRLAARFEVIGVDISAAQLEIARRNVPRAKFIEADMASVDFPAASFDGINALYSLTHLPRAEHAALLAKLARWLRPGGLLLAALSGRDSPDWTGQWLGQEMFFSGFDPPRNRGLLTEAGFALLTDEEVTIYEPEGPARLHWVLAACN